MYYSQDNEPNFVIKLPDYDPPKFVFTARTYLGGIDAARKFRSRRNAEKYIKNHRELSEINTEIVQLSLVWKTW